MSDLLDALIADGVIDEVLGRLKSGKEADISLVRRGDDVLAAKIYKDRATRSFKNNADYKEGRKVRNSRTQRAMDSGGKFGRDAAEQAWKSAEADALYKLVDAGVRVPTPVMFYEGVLLMELVKDAEGRPAPRMIDVAIEPAAAIGVYADLVAQIISMLCCDLIHGDLSPYNILAAADGPTIIDFPQVVSAVHSSRAEFFFLRDFDNVVRFLSGFDPRLAIHRHDGRAIWRAYVARELTREFVPPPPPPPQPSRSGPRWRDQRSDDRRPDPRGQGGPPRDSGSPQRSQGGPPRDGGSPQRSQGGPPRDGGSPQRSPGGPPRDGGTPQRSQGGPRGDWDARPQQAGRGPDGSSSGGPPRTDAPQRDSRDGGPQRDPRSNGAYQGGQRGDWNARPQPDGRRSNGPPQGGASRDGGPPPRRASRDGGPPPRDPRSNNAPPSDAGRPPDRFAGDRGPAPRPPRPLPLPREWSMPASAPSAPRPSPGGRRRPKRRW